MIQTFKLEQMTIKAKNILIVLKPSFWLGGVMCRFGFHDWEISKWCRFKDRKCKYLLEEGFNRTCQRCDKEQTLKRPEKYHPSKYVWTDSNGTQRFGYELEPTDKTD